MKAILLLDVNPKKFGDADVNITVNDCTFKTKGVIVPFPEKMEHSEVEDPFDDRYEDEYEYMIIEGYNQCLTDLENKFKQ